VDQDGIEKFRSGGGRLLGYVALALGLAVAVLVLADGYQSNEWKVLTGIAFFGFASWVVLLRPLVAITGGSLLVRSMLSDVRLPLASVEDVKIRQFLVVRAGGHSWTSTGLGRSKMQLWRLRRGHDDAGNKHADFVEERIRAVGENARAKAGIALLSDEQFNLASGVRPAWSWPVIGGLVGLSVAFLVAVLV